MAGTEPASAWPLAGREPETERFEAVWAQPHCRGVILCGAGGVGTSRLGEEFLVRAARAGARVSRVAAASPATPLAAVRHLVPAGTDLTDPVRGYASVAAALAGSAGGRHVLFVDDLHLLDTASTVLVQYLLSAGGTRLIATVRTGGPSGAALGALAHGDALHRIDVAPFEPAQMEAVLRGALGGPLDRRTLRTLCTVSGGNARYLRELVHGALADGSLRHDGEIWSLAPGAPGLPPALRGLVRARLAAGPPGAHEVLELLALAEPVGLADAVAVAGPAVVAGLEDRGLVRVRQDGRRASVALAHPLYGAALRDAMAPHRRREILVRHTARVRARPGRRRGDAAELSALLLATTGTADPALLLPGVLTARHAHDYRRVEAMAGALPERSRDVPVRMMHGEALMNMARWREADGVFRAAQDSAVTERERVAALLGRTSSLFWAAGRVGQALRGSATALAEPWSPAAYRLLRLNHAAMLATSGRPVGGLEWLTVGLDAHPEPLAGAGAAAEGAEPRGPRTEGPPAAGPPPEGSPPHGRAPESRASEGRAPDRPAQERVPTMDTPCAEHAARAQAAAAVSRAGEAVPGRPGRAGGTRREPATGPHRTAGRPRASTPVPTGDTRAETSPGPPAAPVPGRPAPPPARPASAQTPGTGPAGTPEVAVWEIAAFTRTAALTFTGRSLEAVSWGRRAYETHRGLADRGQAARTPHSQLNPLILALADAGQLEAARALARRTTAELVEADVALPRIWTACFRGRVEWLAGDAAAARRWYAEAVAQARLHGFRPPLRAALAGLAASAALLGDVGAARACVAQMRRCRPMGAPVGEDGLAGGWLLAAQGRRAAARQALWRAALRARRTGHATTEMLLLTDVARLGGAAAALDRLTALGRVCDGPLAAARVCLAAALAADDPVLLGAVARELADSGAYLAAAEAAFTAAAGWRRLGRTREATAAFRQASGWAANCPGVRTPLLAAATSADASGPLTRREREVAGLAAAGHSSRGIATALHLSVRTVDNHLQRAYAKLGVTSRGGLPAALGAPEVGAPAPATPAVTKAVPARAATRAPAAPPPSADPPPLAGPRPATPKRVTLKRAAPVVGDRPHDGRPVPRA